MEQLDETQKAAIKKSSTDRLRLNLLKHGFEEETVLSWKRKELMEKDAEVLLEGAESEDEAQVEEPVAERERWQHEQRMNCH